jgi:hypothetical protein
VRDKSADNHSPGSLGKTNDQSLHARMVIRMEIKTFSQQANGINIKMKWTSVASALLLLVSAAGAIDLGNIHDDLNKGVSHTFHLSIKSCRELIPTVHKIFFARGCSAPHFHWKPS